MTTYEKMSIEQMIVASNRLLNNLKSANINLNIIFAGFLPLRLQGFGIVKVGMQIEDTKYWPVKKGDFTRDLIVPEDGVVIEDKDGSRTYIRNSYYNKRYDTNRSIQ